MQARTDRARSTVTHRQIGGISAGMAVFLLFLGLLFLGDLLLG